MFLCNPRIYNGFDIISESNLVDNIKVTYAFVTLADTTRIENQANTISDGLNVGKFTVKCFCIR